MTHATPYDVFVDIFLYVIDWCILIELMDRMYGKIARNRRLAVLTSFGGIILLVLYSHLSLPSYTNSFFLVPLSFLMLVFYPKNTRKKLLFSLCLLSLTYSYLFMLNDITNMLPFRFPWVMIYLIIFHLGLWGILFLCLHLCSWEQADIPRSLWGILFSIPLCTLIAMPILLIFLSYSTINYYVRSVLHFVLQGIFLSINVLVFILYRRFTHYAKKEAEHALLSSRLVWQERHYQEMMDISEELHAIRHDMKNQLRTASLLYREGKQDALGEYLSLTAGSIEEADAFITTGNPHIDAVLNLKIYDLRKNKIVCDPDIAIPPQLPLSFSHTVTLFGNLLDNALAACLKLEVPRREIQLTVSYQGQSLLIHMDNPVLIDGSGLMPGYGTGLKNVEKTAAAYHGILQTQITDGRYYTDIVLYNL